MRQNQNYLMEGNGNTESKSNSVVSCCLWLAVIEQKLVKASFLNMLQNVGSFFLHLMTTFCFMVIRAIKYSAEKKVETIYECVCSIICIFP